MLKRDLILQFMSIFGKDLCFFDNGSACVKGLKTAGASEVFEDSF